MELLDINKPSISEFYNGRSVFVTGGTGFLGKLVVEKLLRSCPGIENIYFLIRPRHNTHINDRHLKVVNSPAFDLLREKSPEALQKIILIEGDVSCLELGISKTDQEVLFDKVSVIIHAAASVALNDTLKKAVLTNLRSMRELLKLAHQMKNLKWTPRLLKNHENTYVFAKSLAEILITKDGIGLPIAIVRPSIIGACVAEPKVGWTDSYTVVNTIIAASWTVTRENYTCCDVASVKVYNSVSGDVHPITFEQFADLSVNIGQKYPSVLSKLGRGSTPRAAKYYKTNKRIFDAANFVATLPFKFKSEKCEELLNSMEDSPNEEFYFDLRSMDWKTYHHDFYFGIRKFILKEHNLDSVRGKKKLTRLRSMKYFLGFLLIVFVILTVKKLTDLLFKL
ncbi:putative fatty acyl-CoA reductase CG5065 [Chironomus tepperi]|uniref:putative fatty acyl-CoA reductase CG5065 n=1 Tax=Chironomus tepperi TaxID=113505 RepID=UPI00391EF844